MKRNYMVAELMSWFRGWPEAMSWCVVVIVWEEKIGGWWLENTKKKPKHVVCVWKLCVSVQWVVGEKKWKSDDVCMLLSSVVVSLAAVYGGLFEVCWKYLKEGWLWRFGRNGRSFYRGRVDGGSPCRKTRRQLSFGRRDLCSSGDGELIVVLVGGDVVGEVKRKHGEGGLGFNEGCSSMVEEEISWGWKVFCRWSLWRRKWVLEINEHKFTFFLIEQYKIRTNPLISPIYLFF